MNSRPETPPPDTTALDASGLPAWYARWALPHYARMTPDARQQALLVDRFLYSRRGIWVWVGLVCAVLGSTGGLAAAGIPVLLALPVCLLVWGGLPLAGLSAWLAPEKFSQGRKGLRFVAIVTAVGMVGALVGFSLGHVAKRGHFDPAEILLAFGARFGTLLMAVLAMTVGVTLILWGVAQVRRQVLERELAQLNLARERDATARQVAEARLKVLQAQIQPHFLFNTLSALQHWVDSGDPRAASLLRDLTRFLRGSTELLGRDTVTVGEELALVGQYLAVMQARLGERLRWELDVDASLSARTLPPGLLLTLVENAVEHGVAPSLSGGSVRVEGAAAAEYSTLRILNSGQALDERWQDGVGLSNSRERLQHAAGSHSSLTLRPMSSDESDSRGFITCAELSWGHHGQ